MSSRGMNQCFPEAVRRLGARRAPNGGAIIGMDQGARYRQTAARNWIGQVEDANPNVGDVTHRADRGG
jgi:hypothetical protein